MKLLKDKLMKEVIKEQQHHSTPQAIVKVSARSNPSPHHAALKETAQTESHSGNSILSDPVFEHAVSLRCR